MEYAKKGAFGYKTVAEGEDYTHVLLTVAEHKKLQQDLLDAKNVAIETDYDARKQIEAIKKKAAALVQNAKDECQKKVAEITAEMQEAIAEKEYQTRLNTNLLRIAKERANADRNLRPKKDRSGYLVLNSREKELFYKDGQSRKKLVVWETTIQSPHSVELNEKQAKEEIIRDLFDREPMKVMEIGIEGVFYDGFDKMILEDRNRQKGHRWIDHNTVFSLKFNANFRAGFWELTITHLQPLTTVPPDMHP